MSVEKRDKRWLARVCVNGVRGSRMFDTKRAAQDWENNEKRARQEAGKPKGAGPDKTTLAHAMRTFAEEETRMKKGAKQELTRLNKWFALAGHPRLALVPQDTGARFTLRTVDTALCLPRTFAEHRQKRLARSAHADALRTELARTPMGAIANHHLEALKLALVDAGLQPDTVRLELALLKRIFTVSRDKWNWRYQPFPFTKFDMPAPGKAREQRLPTDKQEQLFDALAQSRNPFILPYVQLAIETTMRRSEVLFTATWDDVDLARRRIHLRTDKAGDGREVLLSLRAVELLQQLPRKPNDQRIFPLTPDQLHAAWKKACACAGVTNFRVHDLRHEGASRYALQLNGNLFLLKKITGHRNLKMLERYVHLDGSEVLEAMDRAADQRRAQAAPSVSAPFPAAAAGAPARPVAIEKKPCARRPDGRTH